LRSVNVVEKKVKIMKNEREKECGDNSKCSRPQFITSTVNNIFFFVRARLSHDHGNKAMKLILLIIVLNMKLTPLN
jgi:hypothetical protein